MVGVEDGRDEKWCGSPLVVVSYNLRMAAFYAAAEISKYIGVFLKVVGFDETEPLSHGTGGRYRRALPVLVVITVVVAWN